MRGVQVLGLKALGLGKEAAGLGAQFKPASTTKHASPRVWGLGFRVSLAPDPS